MSFPNIRPSDRLVLRGVIDPDANTAATYTTGWVSLADFGAVMAIVFAGDLGSSATIDAKIEQAKDASATGSKDLTGKAITTLTDSNVQAIINVRGEDLDVANGYTHVRLSMTVGTATSDSGAAIFGVDARYAPADAADTVSEVV
ncbi:MAG TPA: hypothetical protein VG538_06130 [Vicinamibacterales bacterium]|jgi:hypothetical protein|nr:hypothetical protein [Vicinamibacterales bacterium]